MQRLTINKNERNKEDSRTGSYDALVNGIPADFKRTASHNNIKKYAKRAIQIQGAKIIVFQFDIDTPLVHRAVLQTASKGVQVIYFFTDRPSELFWLNKTAPNEFGAE